MAAGASDAHAGQKRLQGGLFCRTQAIPRDARL